MTKVFQPEYPHVIQNKFGEKLIFKRLIPEPDGDRLEVENFVEPGCGPVMHTHIRQEESLTVVSGKLGYQLLGGKEQFAEAGQQVIFKPGTAHRFWNAGATVLNCTGYIKPADSIVYFLTKIYQSMDENGGRPGAFDGAFLLARYKSEFGMPGIPVFVRKVIFPVTVFFGKLTGKHKKFADAPPPVV